MTLSRRLSTPSLFAQLAGSSDEPTSASRIPNPTKPTPSYRSAQDTQESSQQLFLSCPPQLLDVSDCSMPIESQITVPETATQESISESQENAVSQLQDSEPPQLIRPPVADDIPTALSATGEHTKAERVESPPPFKSIDFAYLPKPEPSDLPVDEKWVVRLPKGLKGNRLAVAAAIWESDHAYLYRGRGNRADPPGTIPKKWGGLTKELDEALMQYEENRISSWEKRLRERGITPTESATSSPRSPLTQEEEEEWLEEYENNRKYAEECRRKIAAGEIPASSVIHKIRSNGVTYTAAEYMKMRDEQDRKALAEAEAQHSKKSFAFKDSVDSVPSRPRAAFGMLRAHKTMYWDDDKCDDNEDGKGKAKAKDEAVERRSPARSTSQSTDSDSTDETLKRKREGPKVDDDEGKKVVRTTPRKRSKVRPTEEVNPEIESRRTLPSRACKVPPVIKPSHAVASSNKPARKTKRKGSNS